MTDNMRAIESKLSERIAAYMRDDYPDIAYTLDCFDSDNGDDDWPEPFAANLSVPSLGVDDAYGLCDAAADSVDNQVDYMLSQVIEELSAAVGIQAFRGGNPPHSDGAVEWVVQRLASNITHGSATYGDVCAAKWVLADSNLDFERGDELSIAFHIAVASGETAEARDYLTAITADPAGQWRQGMYAQAESRIFGYLGAMGRV